MNGFSYQISGSAFKNSPVELVYGLIYTEGDILEIPQKHPFKGEWGTVESPCMADCEPASFPLALEICYLSISQQTFYTAQIVFPDGLFEMMWMPEFNYILFGMAPNGKIVVWLSGEKKSIMLLSIQAEKTEMDMTDVSPFATSTSVEEFCSQYKLVQKKNEHLNVDMFDVYTKQYNYRFCIQVNNAFLESGKERHEKDLLVHVEYIEESLYDGTHDKLHDGGLMKYHQAGKPKKLRVEWHIGKSEYSAYFWFEDERIREVFDRFYGAHPDTKTDFIIRIDAEKRKYELALYRYGLKEPQVIPEDVYQLLVFKNKFEDYRSENYNQERGAWIW